MISPTGYAIRCDQTECDRVEQHESSFLLTKEAKAEGWQLGVKLNGEQAKRGGKDYCPDHSRGPA